MACPRSEPGQWLLCFALSAVLVTIVPGSLGAGTPDPGAGDSSSPGVARLQLESGCGEELDLTLALGRAPDHAEALTRALARVTAAPDGRVTTSVSRRGWTASLVRPRGLERHGLIGRARLDLDPLLSELRRRGVTRLDVTLSEPMGGFARLTGVAGSRRGQVTRIPLDRAGPRSGTVAFGFTTADLARNVLPLALALLLPPVFALALRARALSSPVAEAQRSWRTYGTWEPAVGFSAWWLWLTVTQWTPPLGLLLFQLPAWSPTTFFILATATYLLPPVAIELILAAQSHAVATRLGQAQRTLSDAFHETLGTRATVVIPAILVTSACLLVSLRIYGPAAFLGVLGIAGVVPLARLAWRTTGLSAVEAPPGEFRDRVLALATRAGVRLRGVKIVSPDCGRFLNAFAAPLLRTVAITDQLLAGLSRREVDGVMAHEISHVGRRLSQRLVVPVLLSSAALASLQWRGVPAKVLILFVPLLALLALRLFRHIEIEADRGGVELTGDAEAFVSGEARLCRLTKEPLHLGRWEGLVSTHPAPIERLRAVARRAGLDQRRFERIIERGCGDDRRYQVPAPPGPRADGLQTGEAA
ncbi:MAG: M48 family metalloprotease [Candidatus Eisenbacteria bacterium]|nr:M48 family metalloprotease [Candidatus Eisenbacteria bacterium]